MAELNDYGKSVAAAIKLIVANNPGATARALKQIGAETKDFVPNPQLEADLWTLHAANRERFYQVLNSIPWNYGNNNWTNDPKYRNAIINTVGAQSTTNAKINLSNIWQSVVGALQGQSSQNTTTTTTGTDTQTVIVLSIISLAILGILFYVIKSK